MRSGGGVEVWKGRDHMVNKIPIITMATISPHTLSALSHVRQWSRCRIGKGSLFCTGVLEIVTVTVSISLRRTQRPREME